FNYISVARREYGDIPNKAVLKSFVYRFVESATPLLDNYLHIVEAYRIKTNLHAPLTAEDITQKATLMRSLVEQTGISERAQKVFREEILRRISAYARKGERFDYNSHERLREAFQKKLFADLKDVVKIPTSSRTPDESQLKKINDGIARLIDEYG